jgi:membrane-associated phospholipid phosphatase
MKTRIHFILILSVLPGFVWAQQFSGDYFKPASDSVITNTDIPVVPTPSFKLYRPSVIPYIAFGVGLQLRHGPILVSKYKLQEEIAGEMFAKFHTHVDNYLQFAPIAAPFILDIWGVKSYHSQATRNKMIFESSLLTIASISLLKRTFNDQRPDGKGYQSFPSGHTAIAFTGAAILAKEYGKRYPWIKWTGYGVATLVGLSRIANNRHWGSDVIAGAAVGVITTDLVYLANRKMLVKKVRMHAEL